jgi:hypothetical protein
MRLWTILLCTLAIVPGAGMRADAQDPPPPIGPLVIDLRGTFPKFPGGAALADSRGLPPSALPGRGIGVEAGAHVYLLTLGVVTVGLGGQVLLVRSRATPELPLRAVTARFTSLAQQLSFNFGTGDGWSYISGGIGTSLWSIVPDGGDPQTADEVWVRTFNYGGGARWFVKPRVAFHIDVRMHAIDPGPPQPALPGSPRTNLLTMGVGFSVR